VRPARRAARRAAVSATILAKVCSVSGYRKKMAMPIAMKSAGMNPEA
jgi:hypothetical protein